MNWNGNETLSMNWNGNETLSMNWNGNETLSMNWNGNETLSMNWNATLVLYEGAYTTIPWGLLGVHQRCLVALHQSPDASESGKHKTLINNSLNFTQLKC